MERMTHEQHWDKIHSKGNLPWNEKSWCDASGKTIRHFLEISRANRVLDFGCGFGRYLDIYASVCNNVTLVDISGVAIKKCKQRRGNNRNNQSPHIKYVKADLDGFVTKNSGLEFDLIVCWGVLHNYPEGQWGNFIKKFSKLLRPNGYLLIGGWGKGSVRFDRQNPVSDVTGLPIYSISDLYADNELRSSFEILEQNVLETPHTIYTDGSGNDIEFNAYQYLFCKKRSDEVSKRHVDLVKCLDEIHKKVYLFQTIKYSFVGGGRDAVLDRANSVAGYWDEELAVEILKGVIQATKGSGSLTANLYDKVNVDVANVFAVKVLSSNNSRKRKKESCQKSEINKLKDLGEVFTVEEDFSTCNIRTTSLKYVSIYDLLNKVEIDNIPFGSEPFDLEKVMQQILHSTKRELYFYCFRNPVYKVGEGQFSDGVLFLYAAKPLSVYEVGRLNRIFTRWSSALTFRSLMTLVKTEATKSAIGSIMSRNGSHNIGSHVLAALTHNVGTMPDDRVLYQYIQHRMDYIATVTTELPSWAASTMFVGEMMRMFLSQHHLLEYIASSEGLKAYKFQDLNIDLGGQSETIQIHVSYGRSQRKLSPVFSFDGKGLEHPIEKDVALAIPGGVVGQHAFFTIVENVIRNAAKHGWASKIKSERENLEIHVDVVDDTRKDYVTFRIWDNMSSVDIDSRLAKRKAVLKFVREMENGNGVKRKRLGFKNPLSTAQTSILIKRFEEESASGFNGRKIIAEEGALPLHWRQQVLMDQRIIYPDGSLRRENWGLAEVKISAGYLQRRTVGQMGGLDILEGEDFIVRAIVLKSSKSEGAWRLGYEFKVPRPRKILIISDTPPKSTSSWKRFGVHFLELYKAKEALEKWRKGEKTDTFSAEYLVVESICELLGRANFSEVGKDDLAAVPFPFRVLSGDLDRTGNEDLTIVPLIKMEDLRSGGNWKRAQDIETCVSETWMNYCCERRGYGSTSVRIDLNTSGNEGGSGQALISDADIWRLLFTEYFHSTLESFSEENCAEDIKLFRRCLLENRTHYKFFADDSIVVEQLASEKLSIDCFDDNAIVARQFQYLLRPENKIVSEDFPSDKIKHELDVVIGECATTDFAAKLQALYNSYLLDCRPDIDRMIRHFKQAFKQLDVILRKYEERIVTLPQAFSILKDVNESPLRVGHKNVEGIAGKVVMYNRHHKVTEADLSKYLYVEPLSGSQSYLNRLSVYCRHDFTKSTGSKALLRTQLIENALMRILIVDERVSRFLRSHEKSRLIFRAMNIWCLDETGTMTDGSSLQEAEKSKGQLLVMSHNAAMDKDKFTAFLKVVEEAQRSGEKGQFDILIIHQGVLDKWCKDASSVSGMEDVIDTLKRVVDYVVITTGRGTPANIPPCTRILPFSTIESTLFKLYPEKMTLVNSIMNILPLGGIRK